MIDLDGMLAFMPIFTLVRTCQTASHCTGAWVHRADTNSRGFGRLDLSAAVKR